VPVKEQAVIKERLVKLLCAIIGRIVLTNDSAQSIEKLFREDLALERSVNFTGSFVTLANVLGSNPRNQISSWPKPTDRVYPLKRSAAWDAGDPPAKKQPDTEVAGLKPSIGQGKPPEELLDYSRTKHTEIQNVSLIRESLWEEARWLRIVYGREADDSAPPILALIFHNADAARKIFSHWRAELGVSDTAERLRVTIVRGISHKEPSSYRVVVGSNHRAAGWPPLGRYVTLVSRILPVSVSSNHALEAFLQDYRRLGSYRLMLGFATEGESEAELDPDRYVIKRELNVREAWELGRNDPDNVAVTEDDSPIIPAGQDNPPVIELLQWKRERRTVQPSTVPRPKQKIGRNDRCPCGSGKKYKKCHGA